MFARARARACYRIELGLEFDVARAWARARAMA